MHSSHIFNVSQTQKQSIMRSSLFLLTDRNDTLESNFQINAHRCACCEWSRKVDKWLNFYLVSKISTDLNSCEICELYFSSFFSFWWNYSNFAATSFYMDEIFYFFQHHIISHHKVDSCKQKEITLISFRESFYLLSFHS